MSKTSVSSMSVIEKGAVTINVSLSALVKYVSDSTPVECVSELRSICMLNAMHRPKDLFDSVKDDAIARLLTLVICREAAVVGRMPIFGRHHEAKLLL